MFSFFKKGRRPILCVIGLRPIFHVNWFSPHRLKKRFPLLPSLKTRSETNHLRLVAFKKSNKIHLHWSWDFSPFLIPLFALREDHFLLSHVFKENKNIAKQEDHFVLFKNQENPKS